MRKTRKPSQKIGAALRALLLWPIVGIMAVLGFRIALISNPGRIGHMCAEMDAFLKERELHLIPDTRPVLLAQRSKSANPALLDVFGAHMPVLDKRWHKLLLTPFAKFDAISLPLGRPVLGFAEAARYYQINQLWGERPPVITLPPEIVARGRAKLAEMGVPKDAWFVCVHAREGGYSPRDEQTHAHRNSDIDTYGPALAEITARGGWIVRMGDASMTPMAPTAQAVDYALSSHKSDWMDLWLCAHNRFLLGTSSGLIMVATMFHKPCLLVNMAPHGSSYGLGPQDLSILKGMVGPDGQALSFPRIFREGLSVQRYAEVFAQRGIGFQDNTPEEILGVTREMLDRLAGDFQVTDEDEDLQRRFREFLSPADYSFGASARLGRDWLRLHKGLFKDVDAG